ncbi:MAG: response regulator transcription factor [Chloroflexota bacterium]|nr:MAG: response regulator transcription factor [Chloroflexota bacterium]
MNEKTILIIDEDRELREWLRSALAERGAHVSTAPNGDEGLRKFFGLLPDLVLMADTLRRRTGMDVLREIRLLTDVPVVMLTADGDPEIVRYLDAGADDYVVKPFERRVLMARIRALFRRARWQRRRAQGLIYDDGRLVIDAPAFRATLDGDQVKLSATEFSLLVHLARRAGQACAYDEILADVWGEAFVRNPEYVHAYIWQLRQKIERNPKKPAYMKSVRGVGYRFVAQMPQAERRRPNGQGRVSRPVAGD